MPIIGELVEIYRAQGIDICTGLGAHDFDDLPLAPFTRFIKNGRSLTDCLGMALQEIYLLENMLSVYRPPHVLIIGNLLGWSTLAIALLLPDSRVVAIDAGFDRNSLDGLDLTNRMAARAGLTQVRAVKGVSPEDVAATVDDELDGRADFIFIDGLHTNEQVVLDFEAVAPKAAKDAIYMFHDVHLFNLYEGMGRIEARAGRAAQILGATPSGIAVLYDPAQHPGLKEAFAVFAPTLEARALVRAEARRHGYRGRLKYMLRRDRAFMKRVNGLCRLVGAKPYALPPQA